MVGANAFTFGDYSFTQVFACGYPESETLTGSVPDSSFFAFKKDSNQFDVSKTEELNFVGTYEM